MEERGLIFEHCDDWMDAMSVKQNGNNSALLFSTFSDNCVLTKYEVMELVQKLNLWLAEQE